MKKPVAGQTREVRRLTCPHDCPDRCGLLAIVEGGRVVEVHGDPQHPVTRGIICRKVMEYPGRIYGPERLLHPMKRTGPKGSAQFQQISWEEAIATIAGRFAEIRDSSGPETILPFAYGGTMGVVQRYAAGSRFFNRLGAATHTRTICSTAGQVGYGHTMGAVRGADPETIPDARLIVIWGVNAVSTNLHLMTQIQQARKMGAEVVVIDVHRNPTARAADHFVQLYPGTDSALALGLMQVIVQEGLHDAAYLEANTIGFDRLRARLEEYPPERVEGITGVPAERIRWLARKYATTKPAFLALGNGPQHHEKGGMATRSCSMLPALVGSWGTPGGGAIRSNGGYFGLNSRALERPDLAPGPLRTINMAQLGRDLLEGDPPFRALYVWSCNPAVILPEQDKVIAGLAREDLFVVVHEQVMTDTARYADILLPNTTCFEQSDYFTSSWHLYASYSEPVIAPVGESRSDYEVFRLLAEAMGFDDPCFRESIDQIADGGFDNPNNPFLEGVTAERLRQEKLVRLNVPGRPYLAFADGRFPTPSGKIELYSSRMEAQGLDPLPGYLPAREGREGDRDLLIRYPLEILAVPNHHFLNSSFADIEKLREKETRPTLEIHPQNAAGRGIADGDPIRVWNDRGECRLHARVIDSVLPGVVVSTGLWWTRHHPEAGVNRLTPSRLADMGGGATFFSNLVQVEKA
ncbi:MAG: molybdopterin-containing oxidoreductase family protein [Chloroflexota bacterium]